MFCRTKLALFGWAVVVTAVLLLVRGDSYDIVISTGITHHSQVGAASGLGEGESPEPNIASLLEAPTGSNLLIAEFLQAALPMVKVKLLKDYPPFASKDGPYHCRDGVCKTLGLTVISDSKRVVSKRSGLTGFKVKSNRPKGSVRISRWSSGLPTGGKHTSYGNRVAILPSLEQNLCRALRSRGRATVKIEFNMRSYSTDRATNVSSRLDYLMRLSKRSLNEPIRMKIYDIISDPDFLFNAYQNQSKPDPSIEAKPSDPSIEGSEGMSRLDLQTLAYKLKKEKFNFRRQRRIQIGKALGGKWKEIAPSRDKIVLEGMRIILNAIFEPTFKNVSHGFRPNLSCHTALQYLKTQFQPCTWFIEGKIDKCFPSIDHQRLMKIVEGKILDRKFTKLIWKSLQAGYFEFSEYKYDIAGASTPQGSIISPILSNIFLDQLDNFVLSLKSKFDLGVRKKAPPYRRIAQEIPTSFGGSYEQSERTSPPFLAVEPCRDQPQEGPPAGVRRELSPAAGTCPHPKRKEGGTPSYKATGFVKRCRRNKRLVLKGEYTREALIDYHDGGYKRLSYVRYADDWLIGIRGNHQETTEILSKVSEFCSLIGLTVNQEKSKITSVIRDKAQFLGTNLKRSHHELGKKSSYNGYRMSQSRKLIFLVPMDRIKQKLKEANFLRYGKSHPNFLWLHLNHEEIIHLYNSVMIAFANYYSKASNYGKFAGYLTLILKRSCCKLLTAKFSLGSMKATYLKFSGDLISPKGCKFVKLSNLKRVKNKCQSSHIEPL